MQGEGPVYVWRYVLRSRAGLNARSSRREFEGALIRVGDGFGCLHPWPELGDAPLESLLCVLARRAGLSPIVVRALHMAALDGGARAKGVSLFEGLGIPASHATVPAADDRSVGEAVRRGFGIVKLKGRRDYAVLADALNGWSRRWPELRWRIDFNEILTRDEALHFCECLTGHTGARVDFLEDPCPYDPAGWMEIKQQSGLLLAMDRHADADHLVPDLFVVKPARDLPDPFRAAGRPLVVTSNMDHPLGQCFAAAEAGRLLGDLGGRVVCGGLQTHGLFEADAFTERLGDAGPEFTSPGGTGLGFDDLLETLPWKRLK